MIETGNMGNIGSISFLKLCVHLKRHFAGGLEDCFIEKHDAHVAEDADVDEEFAEDDDILGIDM